MQYDEAVTSSDNNRQNPRVSETWEKYYHVTYCTSFQWREASHVVITLLILLPILIEYCDRYRFFSSTCCVFSCVCGCTVIDSVSRVRSESKIHRGHLLSCVTRKTSISFVWRGIICPGRRRSFHPDSESCLEATFDHALHHYKSIAISRFDLI